MLLTLGTPGRGSFGCLISTIIQFQMSTHTVEDRVYVCVHTEKVFSKIILHKANTAWQEREEQRMRQGSGSGCPAAESSLRLSASRGARSRSPSSYLKT